VEGVLLYCIHHVCELIFIIFLTENIRRDVTRIAEMVDIMAQHREGFGIHL